MVEKNKVIKNILKRLIDIIGGIIGVIMLIPITLGIFIAKLIFREKGPIFYKQNRIGKDGKLFKMYKYRSMVVGAEKELEKYIEENEELKQEYKKYRKLNNDPRVTKIGKFIRTTNLDEFPQFINVLKGEMSLVGPRPYLESEIVEMKEAYNSIIVSKPGLTGFWQVNQVKYKTFENRVELDVQYINNNSLLEDFKILMKTLKQILKQFYITFSLKN